MFIGANTWLVEGPSDILYIQVLSDALRKRRREGMDSRWTLSPSGGIDKIAPFVRLFGGNDINVAVLSDVSNSDKKKIEAVKREQILKAGNFFTVANFVGQQEADVEDLFDPQRVGSWRMPCQHLGFEYPSRSCEPGPSRGGV